MKRPERHILETPEPFYFTHPTNPLLAGQGLVHGRII